MNEADVRAFVDRARTVIERSPEMSGQNTDLRLVHPLLSALGWDVHNPEVEAGFAVDSEGVGQVDYALLVEDRPAVVVETVPCGTELTGDHAERLVAGLSASGVDWGILTNGRAYLFVARGDGGYDREAATLSDLPERTAVLEHYTRAAAVERAATAADERRRAADRLSDEREALVAELTERLAATAGGAEEGIERATRGFLDGLIASFEAGETPPGGDVVDDDRDAVAGGADQDGAPAADPDDPPDEGAFDHLADTLEAYGADRASAGSAGETTTAADGTTTVGDKTATGSESMAESDTRDDDGGRQARGHADGGGEAEDGEYVVRFFDGRTSVGAVGHARPGKAMAQAVEYLIEHRALDAGLSLPWSPKEGPVVLNREPIDASGQRMRSFEQLSNGYYLRTGFETPASRAIVETLAGRSGLRVRFQGDWAEQDR